MFRRPAERSFRAFGLLFGGSVCIIGGGSLGIYGVLMLYVAPPGGEAPGEVLGPINDVALTVLVNEATLLVALVGTVAFAWEVRENGLLEGDDRLRARRLKEMRRELAEESDVWEPPEEDQTEKSVYQELREEESNGLIVVTHEMAETDPPRVRGVVGNTASTAREDVRILVRFGTADGQRVGTGVATRKELHPGERWEFEIFHREDGESIDTYRILPPETADDD